MENTKGNSSIYDGLFDIMNQESQGTIFGGIGEDTYRHGFVGTEVKAPKTKSEGSVSAQFGYKSGRRKGTV